MKDFFQLQRNIQLRILMTFIGVLCYFTAGASMTIYYNQHLGKALTGILLIIAALVSFFVGMWAGHFSDQRGRKLTMMVGMSASIAGAALAAFSNSPIFFNPWTTFLGFVLSSFGYGFFNSGAEAMLVDITTPENRKIVYSLGYWVLNLAGAIGAGLSGLLFRDHLFALLLLILAGSITNMLITVFLITETFDPKVKREHNEVNIIKAYAQVWKDKTFMRYLLASLFISMTFHQTNFFIPIHLSNSFVTTRFLGIEIYGQRMLTVMEMANTICVILFLSAVRKWTNGWTNKMGFAVGATLMGIGWTVSLLSRTLPFEMLAVFINVFGELIFVPFGQSLRADLMDPERVGVYTGAFSVVDPISSVLCGLLVSSSVFYGDGGMGLIMLIITILAILPGLSAITRYERKLAH